METAPLGSADRSLKLYGQNLQAGGPALTVLCRPSPENPSLRTLGNLLVSAARPGSAPPRTGAPIPSIMTPRRAGFRELGFETAGPEASPGGVGDYDSRNS